MKQLKDKATDDRLKLHATTLRRLSDAMTDDRLKGVVGGALGSQLSRTGGGCP